MNWLMARLLASCVASTLQAEKWNDLFPTRTRPPSSVDRVHDPGSGAHVTVHLQHDEPMTPGWCSANRRVRSRHRNLHRQSATNFLRFDISTGPRLEARRDDRNRRVARRRRGHEVLRRRHEPLRIDRDGHRVALIPGCRDRHRRRCPPCKAVHPDQAVGGRIDASQYGRRLRIATDRNPYSSTPA